MPPPEHSPPPPRAEQAKEQPFSFEKWLSLELPQQYSDQARALNEVGLLEILPDVGEKGIVALDGKEYPIPTREEIAAELKEGRELYETKMKQGFRRILMVPLGWPLSRFFSVAEKQILKHHREKKLFYPKKNPNDSDEPLVPLKDTELDTKQPLFVWEQWKDADTSGTLKYYPEEFTENNHRGLTKAELLKQTKASRFPGWNIILLEESRHLPRVGQGTTKGGRKQLETNQTPTQYLEQLKKHSSYQGEDGETLEDELTDLITNLHLTNQVIDDWQGHGSLNFLLGNFQPVSGYLPYACWYRGSRRFYVFGSGPRVQRVSGGARPAVRLRKKA